MKQSTIKSKWLLLIGTFCVVLAITACEEEADPCINVFCTDSLECYCDDNIEAFPHLMLKNLNTDGYRIYSVNLVGYDFMSLNIVRGASQTFSLDKGMPGGYENINVNVSSSDGAHTVRTSFNADFVNGDTTTIIYIDPYP